MFPNRCTSIALMLIVIVVSAIGIERCTTVQRRQLASDEIDCGKEGLAEAVTNIIPQVTLALVKDDAGQTGIDWRTQLDNLKTYGADTLLCAVAAVIRSLTPAAAVQTPQRQAFMAVLPAESIAVANGREYLAKQRLKPVLK